MLLVNQTLKSLTPIAQSQNTANFAAYRNPAELRHTNIHINFLVQTSILKGVYLNNQSNWSVFMFTDIMGG
jgi:hypothetical protein